MKGTGLPASDLQSQLNDMLDDSASDNSSSLQSLGIPNASLPANPTPLGLGGAQGGTAQGTAQGRAAGRAGLQHLLAMRNEEDENDTDGLQLMGQQVGFDQQQMEEMTAELQVSDLLD